MALSSQHQPCSVTFTASAVASTRHGAYWSWASCCMHFRSWGLVAEPPASCLCPVKGGHACPPRYVTSPYPIHSNRSSVACPRQWPRRRCPSSSVSPSSRSPWVRRASRCLDKLCLPSPGPSTSAHSGGLGRGPSARASPNALPVAFWGLGSGGKHKHKAHDGSGGGGVTSVRVRLVMVMRVCSEGHCLPTWFEDRSGRTWDGPRRRALVPTGAQGVADGHPWG